MITMKTQIKKHEHGQVMVILVVALVILLGFAALAIDGGMLFSDRRYDQNAADASAYAGAGAAATYLEQHGMTYMQFGCNVVDVKKAMQAAVTSAVQRAAANNFNIETSLSNQNGVEVTCGSTSHGTYVDVYIDVHVMITSTIKSSFAHLLFGGSLTNTVEAVTRVRPRTANSFGYAVASLDHGCQGGVGGVEFDGDSLLTIQQSGVFSNSCLLENGGIVVEVDTGVFYMTTYSNNGTTGYISPSPALGTERIPDWDIDPPDCSLVPVKGRVNNGGDISPGRYTDIRVENKPLNMEPGLYCLSGSFTANGGTISVTGDNKDGVTIYLTSGGFNTMGNVTVNLRAPMNGSVGLPPSIKGMLIYLAVGNTSEAIIRGDADSTYRGTVYAPSGDIEVGGGASALGELSSQFIANTVKIHGTSNMNVEFNDEEVWTRPAYLALFK
jgi:hypothetical protein